MSPKQKDKLIAELTAEMRSAAAKLEFEKAAYLRDRIKRIQGGEEI
jgi:excinuclease UvrABC nuclease subunit